MATALWVDVSWLTPAEIVTDGVTKWDYIRIYRSANENTGYSLVSQELVAAREVTFNIADPGTVTLAAHGLTVDTPITFTTTGVLPAALTVGNIYYVAAAPSGYFTVKSSLSGTAVEFVDVGTGVASVTVLSLSEIESNSTGTWITTWQDTSLSVTDSGAYFYIIRYYDSTLNVESKFYLTVKSLTPKEQRFVNHVKNITTQWLGTVLGDDDIRAGIIFGLNALNINSPATDFSLDTLPAGLEPLLIMGSATFTLMYKYLGIAFTDLSYSDNGLSLTVDRGAKVQAAVDKMTAYYDKLVGIAKMEYAYGGSGVGTSMLPVGGNLLGRNTMGILDALTSVGR